MPEVNQIGSIVESRFQWGPEDPPTVALLKRTNLSGRWLNLAAGDGRYSDLLLSQCSEMVAADLDAAALGRLVKGLVPETYDKVETQLFDLREPFPLEDHAFDGLLCTGTLHLFQPERLAGIFAEVFRVVRPGGRVIFDFATDVRRVLSDGGLYRFPGERIYAHAEALGLLSELLSGRAFEIVHLRVPDQAIELADVSYIFSCKGLLINCKVN